MTTEDVVIAYVIGEGWVRLVMGVDGRFCASTTGYTSLLDLLHDCGDCQRCIIAL